MRCDLQNLSSSKMSPKVSIPAGFSDALRPECLSLPALTYPIVVSIPAGFSDALRHIERHAVSWRNEFQSLLGFLMRCDVIRC